MMVSHVLPIPLPFTSELYGVRLLSGCWLFAKQMFQPSYWMMLKREGFSGDLAGSSSELSMVLGMLGAEHLRAIYTLYHGTPPTHYFDFSLRGDIEHLILSGRIKAFYLSEDKSERLGNPQDVLYANPETIRLNCESPVVAQRYRLAEELATDIMARWTQKDAEDLAHWDRFFLWRKGYEVYDITAEAFDTVYDFIVGLKDIAVFVVEISYASAKTHLKVNRALLEMTYKGATGDIEGLRADLNKIGVMVDKKIDSAQKLIAQAEQGKKIFDALVNDPLTRNLIFDFLDSLYQSVSYRESRTFKARVVFEIGIEVLLVLATAGIGNVARRTAQTTRAANNAIKTTKTAQRIGPFTKHALDLMADLGKVLHKPIKVEEIKPIKKLEIPDFGKLEKSELDGVGGSKATVTEPESKPSTSAMREGEGIPSNIRPLRDQINDLSLSEQKLVKDFNAGFTPQGVSKEEALDFIFNTKTGQAQLKSAKLGDPTADNATILNRVLEQVQSGANVPIQREVTTPLVKIVPESRTSAGYGPFFTTPEQLEIARNSGRSLSDVFGLPGGSDAEVYRVFQIRPKGSATVFESTIAPTTELNGKLKTQGGLQQFLVPNRNQFEDATELFLIRDNS